MIQFTPSPAPIKHMYTYIDAHIHIDTCAHITCTCVQVHICMYIYMFTFLVYQPMKFLIPAAWPPGWYLAVLVCLVLVSVNLQVVFDPFESKQSINKSMWKLFKTLTQFDLSIKHFRVSAGLCGWKGFWRWQKIKPYCYHVWFILYVDQDSSMLCSLSI